MSKTWLPVGAHRDLNIEHDPGLSAGSFTGGGWKLCWHITVSPWLSVDSMVRVLKAKRAEPHVVIGGRPGYRFPVVVQLLPFDRAGRALANTSAGGETNRANCIQVEICARPGNVRVAPGAQGSHPFGYGGFDLAGLHLPEPVIVRAQESEDVDFDVCMLEGSALGRQYVSGVAGWTEDTYKALANLARMIDYRVPIPAKAPRSFRHPRRYTARGWTRAEGHVGHVHCPENTHWDPTPEFRGRHLVRLIGDGFHDL